MLLIGTLSYLFFFNYFVLHSESWYPILQSGFPHVDKSFGLIGAIFGLYLCGMLLRIPLSILYKFSFPILIIYGISNLGCLGGHCGEVHTGLFHFQDYVTIMVSFEIGRFLGTGLLSDQFSIPILFKIIAGFIAIATLYQFKDKFKNPRNIFLMVFSSIFLISFTNQFLIDPSVSHPVFDQLLGMNIFQWAIMIVTSLMLLTVFTNESNRKNRNPKLKIKQPSHYKIFSIYAIIFFIGFQDSSFISETNPAIFIIGFSFTTFFLILYFHKKIRLSAIRYPTIMILLAAGILFLQTGFFNPKFGDSDYSRRNLENKTKNGGADSLREIHISSPVDHKNLPYINSHQLGHQSLTFSPINTFADIIVEKYTDHTLEEPVTEDKHQ
jgi:hypothetical protein